MPNLKTRYADFRELEKVLNREKTEKPVLFEIFFDYEYYEFFSECSLQGLEKNSLDFFKVVVKAFENAGFVYATIHGSEFTFPKREQAHGQSISINDGCMITDEESFEAYQWMDPDKCDYSKLDKIKEFLPDNMKIITMGPSGVLENVTALIGYDNMCYMLYEDEELLQNVFDKVGSTMLRYYERCLEHDTVGAIIVNDDWGFNTQTFLSTKDMRKYVFPWHKKIVEAAHKAGKKAILHSCGYMNEVFEDIIEDMKYDAKHSYEDNIFSVEKSYEKWGDRIAILGGLDIDYLSTADIDVVKKRAKALADIGVQKGGYALGSGNSLCAYIPRDKAMALIETATNY